MPTKIEIRDIIPLLLVHNYNNNNFWALFSVSLYIWTYFERINDVDNADHKFRVSYLSWRSIWESPCNHWGFVRCSEVHLECPDSEPSSLSVFVDDGSHWGFARCSEVHLEYPDSEPSFLLVFVDDESRALCSSGRCSCECSQEEVQPQPTGTETFSPAEIYLQSAYERAHLNERSITMINVIQKNTSYALLLKYWNTLRCVQQWCAQLNQKVVN